MSGSTALSPRGLDLQRLNAWLAVHHQPLLGGSLTAQPLAGGKSNFTYEVTSGGRVFVLRRPPLGNVLPTAHDMAREYRVMDALAGTDVPVPQMLAQCDDPAVIGAPFYLMERVPGISYFRSSDLEPLGKSRVRNISEALVDALVRLHQVDHHAVGLTDFGRPDGFLARQVSRWRRQLEASRTRDLRDLTTLHRLLQDSVPPDGPPGIVHGDYKLDNVLVQDDTARGIIDWEMSTIGDTLTDLALLVVYKRLGDLAGSASITDSASAAGFLSEREILERYAYAIGRTLDGFGFYLGLAAFKLAGILEGVHHRFLNGQTLGEGFDQVAEIPEILIASGITSMKEYS